MLISKRVRSYVRTRLPKGWWYHTGVLRFRPGCAIVVCIGMAVIVWATDLADYARDEFREVCGHRRLDGCWRSWALRGRRGRTRGLEDRLSHYWWAPTQGLAGNSVRHLRRLRLHRQRLLRIRGQRGIYAQGCRSLLECRARLRHEESGQGSRLPDEDRSRPSRDRPFLCQTVRVSCLHATVSCGGRARTLSLSRNPAP